MWSCWPEEQWAPCMESWCSAQTTGARDRLGHDPMKETWPNERGESIGIGPSKPWGSQLGQTENHNLWQTVPLGHQIGDPSAVSCNPSRGHWMGSLAKRGNQDFRAINNAKPGIWLSSAYCLVRPDPQFGLEIQAQQSVLGKSLWHGISLVGCQTWVQDVGQWAW